MTFDRDMKWDAKYKRLCCEMLDMNPYQAEMHFRTAPEFDRGYTPFWYITEELNCNFIERKKNVQPEEEAKEKADSV